MADTPTKKPRPIDAVTTFVATVAPPATADVVAKFAGRHTLRTLAAARRIRAKKRIMKIPRNLLRQLFRACGGWDPSYFKEGWEVSISSWSFSNEEIWKAAIGELILYGRLNGGQTHIYFAFRGRRVGRILHLPDSNNARGFFFSMGEQVTGQPITET